MSDREVPSGERRDEGEGPRQSRERGPRRGAALTRASRAWRGLSHDRRRAAYASAGLFVTLFLPWYQETVIARGTNALQNVSESLTGWGAFSFVEAAVLVVACGVLALLFIRAEGRPFRVPFGDGGVITAAGLWTCLLIVWRIFDKQGTSNHGQLATTSGIEWGIFVALAVAAFLAYSGARIRATSAAEDLGRDLAPDGGGPEGAGRRRRPERRAGAGEPAGATGADLAPTAPRRRRPRVSTEDSDLFEPVDTEWPEQATEPKLTRRRMSDEELGRADGPAPDELPSSSPHRASAPRERGNDEQLTMPLEREE